jgi:photosystem II stability/assembly factor-like uncharacterized protein
MTRRLLTHLALSLLVLVFAFPALASRRRASRSPILYPQCSMITGTGAVTFTRDEGATLAPAAESMSPIAYTWGVVALDEPDTLLAWHDSDLLLSKDGGCSWRVAAHIEGWDFPPTLTAAKGGRAYAWSENRQFLYRYDARGAVSLKQPVPFMGVGVDPANGDRLRAGGDDGSVWESVDAGQTWTHIGALTGPVGFYRFAFDPANLDHVIAGTVVAGAHVSRDGGKTWTRATGLGTRSTNVFNIVFSPVDSNRAWAMGIDLDTSGRHIYVSSDGGESWQIALTERPGVKLINGPIMAAHPTNRDTLYFIFGTHFQGYGTDVFRLDLARGLTVTHNDHDGVNAIAFSRRDPNVMYLGLEKIN